MRSFLLALALLPIFASAGMHGKPDEYFDILGTGHKDWRLAFRGTAHIQKSVYDAYRDGTGIPYVIEDGCKTIDWKAPCNNHYRNADAMNNWSNIREVLYGLVDHGMLVKVMRFKGASTNNLNWMKQNFLIESCWEDLKDARPNYFSINGYPKRHRRFFINNNYGGCDKDAGWTVVVDHPSPACPWEKNETYPYIKYVAGQKYENWNSYRIRSADAIVVFLNYYPGEPEEYHDLFHTGKKEWRLAFRGTAKVGQPVYPAYEDGTGVKYYMEDACKTVNFHLPCTSHYRNNDALNHWKNIDQVLFGIIYKGEMVKTIFFKGEHTTYMNWYEPEHLLKSCWDDLPMGPHKFFSIAGDKKLLRRFFIQRNYDGCSKDAGWMVVSDQPPTPCPWETTTIFPIIKFAAGPKVENWSKGQALDADAFVIFLKYKKL
ncbi:hypothetical protein RRG08_028049 [Elysia crispata]|uniref:Uncharacterized protein n=1 Tax=Elysia crispata TaxID=231223 RepID=A0AAE1A7Q8_9GAST|nr:hypothetical protein RRG08_028049 [Elysia crispata]